MDEFDANIAAGGVLAALILFLLWILLKGARSKSDKASGNPFSGKIAKLDEQIAAHSKYRKYEARNLIGLLLELHEKAIALGLRIGDRSMHIDGILSQLNSLKKIKLGSKEEKAIINNVNTSLNVYLNNFPGNNTHILKLIAEIKKIQRRIYGEVREEVMEREFSGDLKAAAGKQAFQT